MKTTLIQCTFCGQIVASKNPENLKRVCLACCTRIKGGDPDTPFITFSADTPIEVYPCHDREETPAEQCTKAKTETETC